jgi:hypothetical protein
MTGRMEYHIYLIETKWLLGHHHHHYHHHQGAVTVYLVQRLGYGLDDLWFESQQREEIFLLSKNVQIGCGAHPASYSMGTMALSPAKSGQGVELTTPI